MGAVFKPGDVAAGSYGTVFRTDDGWLFDDGSGPVATEGVIGFRPLVVLDPESDADVCRVAEALDGDVDWLDLRAALRSLVSPPRPPEPTGLGAVVEDAEGKRFTRVSRDALAPWFTDEARDSKRPYRYFSDLNAVHVLSEGVTS